METLLSQIRSFAETANASARDQLKLALRDLSQTLENDDDMVRRVGYNALESASIQVCLDLGVFELLVEGKEALGAETIAAKTGAQTALVERILRWLASLAYVTEIGPATYKANATTERLVNPANQAGIYHMWHTCGPTFLEMPSYLKKTKYAEPLDYHHTVFQDAFKTDKAVFEWFQDHPENLKHFNHYMAWRRNTALSWLSVYPVEAEAKGCTADRALYVNMGGSIGHQCAEFKKAHPDLPGRVILQDLPHTIAKALQTPGVENMAHDFTNPQPIKGAKFYFLRSVLHNHTDERVRVILGHVREAMVEDSVLIIDDLVLPDTGANAVATGLDLAMMCAMSSRERTRSQWRKLLAGIGLKVDQEFVYKPSMYETVMKVTKA